MQLTLDQRNTLLLTVHQKTDPRIKSRGIPREFIVASPIANMKKTKPI